MMKSVNFMFTLRTLRYLLSCLVFIACFLRKFSTALVIKFQKAFICPLFLQSLLNSTYFASKKILNLILPDRWSPFRIGFARVQLNFPNLYLFSIQVSHPMNPKKSSFFEHFESYLAFKISLNRLNQVLTHFFNQFLLGVFDCPNQVFMPLFVRSLAQCFIQVDHQTSRNAKVMIYKIQAY